jgi:hypothetical protein
MCGQLAGGWLAGGTRQMAYGRRQIAKYTETFLLIRVIVWDMER